MPTYDYKCTKCGHAFEVFHSMAEKPLRRCPACQQNSLKRLIGPGAALIFKGSGFYCTDYRKSGPPAPDASGADSSSSTSPSTSKGGGNGACSSEACKGCPKKDAKKD